MMELVPPDALWAEAFQCVGLPAFAADVGAWSVSKALESFWKKRAEDAQIRICDELRKGNITLTQASLTDGHFAAFVRMAQAVRDSASHEAIRLMAKVMVGQILRDQLYADEFNRFAAALAGLSRQELIALSCLHMAHDDSTLGEATSYQKAIKIAVPFHFQSMKHLEMHLVSAGRSGLVVSHPVLGGMSYSPSPLLNELVQLADFQDALRAEGVPMSDNDGRQEPHL